MFSSLNESKPGDLMPKFDTNILHNVIWFQVLLSNTYNLYTVNMVSVVYWLVRNRSTISAIFELWI